MRYPLVLFTGAAIGAIITVVLGMTVPAVIIGALIGAVAAWTTYDVDSIVRAAPAVAAKAFASLRREWHKIAPWIHAVLRMRLGAWFFVGLIFAGVCTAHPEKDDPIIWACFLLGLDALIILLMLSVDAEYEMLKHTGRILDYFEREGAGRLFIGGDWTFKEFGSQLRALFVILLVILAIPCEFTIYVAPKVIRFGWRTTKFVASIPVACAVFAWRLFVAVHSEKRLMAFVDSGVGVLASYIGLRWYLGAAFTEATPSVQLTFIALAATIAVAWGMFNCEIVARRGLRITPA